MPHRQLIKKSECCQIAVDAAFGRVSAPCVDHFILACNVILNRPGIVGGPNS